MSLGHVAFLERVDLIVVTATLSVGLHLAVDHLVGDLNGVVGNLILGGQLGVELRSQSDIEDEYQLLGLEVNSLLFLAGEGIAEHIDFLLAEITIEFL